MDNKNLLKDLIAVWISVTALVCAALNMHVSRNMLETEDTTEDSGGEGGVDFRIVLNEDLYEDLKSNGGNTYKGENIVVDGIVDTVAADGSSFTVVPEESEYKSMVFTCYDQNGEHTEEIKALTPGSSIYVLGTVTDADKNGYKISIFQTV